MDQVYKVYDRQASSKICLKDYFQQYTELIKSSNYYENDTKNQEKIFQLMDMDLSEARILLMKHYCSIDNLTLPVEAVNVEEGEKQRHVNVPEKIADNIPLETIKILKKISKEPLQKLRNENGIPIKYDDTKLLNDDSLKPNEEFLVYVRVYDPFRNHLRSTRNRLEPFLKLKAVISILGCQTLYDLRRKIMCPSDLSISKDISETPNQKAKLMAKDIYPSGFFYIEDTFYNDTSQSTNIDYSSVILKWAANRNIGPFKVATMDAQINSLCTRFGFPWVYQHQGCCEHLIIFSDARLLTIDDVLTPSVYPRIERVKAVFGRNCIYCGLYNAHWIVTEHNRTPHGLSYFCNKCFISYNYIDGKKVGEFKAYSYPCISKLLLSKHPKMSKQESNIK